MTPKNHFALVVKMWYYRRVENGERTAVLEEMLEPVTRAFSRDVAQALVNIKASDAAQARIAEPAEKCSEGSLTPD